MEPLISNLRTITLCLIGLLALYLTSISKQRHLAMLNGLKTLLLECIAPAKRFYVVIGSLCIAAFLVGQVSQIAGNLLEWPAAVDFGGKASGISLGLCLVFLFALYKAINVNQEQRQQEAVKSFLKPKEIMKIDIQGHNYAPVAQAKEGAQIHQSMEGNSTTVVNRDTIYAYADAVKKELQLSSNERAEAVEQMHMIADQWERPIARREPSKVIQALERVSGIVSSISTLAAGLQKLEPFIKDKFGIS